MKQGKQEQAVQEVETIGQPVPIRQLQSPPFRADDLTAAIKQVLEKHGGDLEISSEAFTLRFPEETTMQELYPRVNFTRYRIRFPDGYEIMKTMDCNGNTFDIGFPEEDIPGKICKRYKR